MKTLKDIELTGRRVLVRFDFNVPLNESGQITNAKRLTAALPTITRILNAGGRLVIMSHLGRPNGKPSNSLTLRPVLKWLSDKLNRSISFSKEITGPKAVQASKALKNGEVLVLENIRFDSREETGDISFAKELSELGDVYINDAFGTAHREHASTSIIARYFKGCCAFGDVMFKEIDNVNKVLSSKNGPKIAIVGGAKVSSKIIILKSLIDSVDELIICGGMAFTFIKALGGQIGDSICEADKIDIANSILEAAEGKGVKIHLPTDVLAAKDFSSSAQTKYCDIYEIPEGWQGLDAGKETIEYFSGVIESAKTLLWNGPLGVFELEPFSHGTRIIGEKIAKETKRGLFSLVGGGDSVAAVEQFKLSQDMSYVSTGGGAMLEFLEGKSLPGIQAILSNN